MQVTGIGTAQGTAANSAAAPAAGGTNNSNNSISAPQLGEYDFLKLLTTQLQYQDPLQPTDNTQFVAQLAQFSSLEGITNLGTTMKNVLSGVTSLQNYTAASFVGKNATAKGNSFVYSSSPVTMGYSLPGDAADVSVSIRDSSGKAVKTIDMGSKPGGQYMLTWDGTDANGAAEAPGSYSFAVNAVDSNKKPIAAGTFIAGPISSVNFDSGSTNLVVSGVTVPEDAITSIY